MDNKSILKQLSSVVLFHGSLQEYEKWRGYKCEILGPSYSLPESVKHLDREDVEAIREKPLSKIISDLNEDDLEMANSGIEAIVNVQDFSWGEGVYNKAPIGLPVRKKI